MGVRSLEMKFSLNHECVFKQAASSVVTLPLYLTCSLVWWAVYTTACSVWQCRL